MPFSIRIYRTLFAITLFGGASVGLHSDAGDNANANQPWDIVTTSDSSAPTERHETSAAVWNGMVYLIGGRGTKPVDRYDPVNNTWTSLQPTPSEIHHIQPVVWDDKIYLVGGFTCCYPSEDSLTHIQIYDPASDTWSVGSEIPEARRRGSAATVVYNDKIYMLGGNTNGHNGGAVSWFDEYDPVNDTWMILTDAPNARDHFSAVVLGDELVAAGGRQTAQPDPFLNTVAAVNIFDFNTMQWRTGTDIPTQRAGVMTVPYGTEAIVAGGEVSENFAAYDIVQAYNVATNQWRTLQAMRTARHSGGAVVLGDAMHVIAGGIRRGGGQETNEHEKLLLNPDDPPPVDSDTDGLPDVDEIDIYMTQVDDADSDDDMLDDGKEITLGTNPLVADTDLDSLTDGEEVLQHLTNPLSSDSDQDTLSDPDEILTHLTNPRSKDTDGDGLHDNLEVAGTTDPLVRDTDGDGLSDGEEVNNTTTSPTNADTDGDSLSDGDEVMTHLTDPLLEDTDGDSLSDSDELAMHMTNPLLADTDSDLLSDSDEINLRLTDPLLADTDSDLLSDGAEALTHMTDPLMADTDGDTLRDGPELLLHGTDPRLADTDGDQLEDHLELNAGFDPLKADTDDDGVGDFEQYNKRNGGGGVLWGMVGLLLTVRIRRIFHRLAL